MIDLLSNLALLGLPPESGARSSDQPPDGIFEEVLGEALQSSDLPDVSGDAPALAAGEVSLDQPPTEPDAALSDLEWPTNAHDFSTRLPFDDAPTPQEVQPPIGPSSTAPSAPQTPHAPAHPAVQASVLVTTPAAPSFSTTSAPIADPQDVPRPQSPADALPDPEVRLSTPLSPQRAVDQPTRSGPLPATQPTTPDLSRPPSPEYIARPDADPSVSREPLAATAAGQTVRSVRPSPVPGLLLPADDVLQTVTPSDLVDQSEGGPTTLGVPAASASRTVPLPQGWSVVNGGPAAQSWPVGASLDPSIVEGLPERPAPNAPAQTRSSALPPLQRPVQPQLPTALPTSVRVDADPILRTPLLNAGAEIPMSSTPETTAQFAPIRATLAESQQLARPQAVRLESTKPSRPGPAPVLREPAGAKPQQTVESMPRLQGADVNGPTLETELFRLPSQRVAARPEGLASPMAPQEPSSQEGAPRRRARPTSAAPRAQGTVSDGPIDLRVSEDPVELVELGERPVAGPRPASPETPSPLNIRRIRVEVDADMALEVSVRAEGVEVAVDGTKDSLEQLDALEPELRAALDEGTDAIEQGRAGDLGDAWGESERRERSMLLSYEQIERKDGADFESHGDFSQFAEEGQASDDPGAGPEESDGESDRDPGTPRSERAYRVARDWRGKHVDRIA